MTFYDKSQSFTIRYDGLSNILISDVWVSEPNDKDYEVQKLAKSNYKAIWDTGATNTVITQKVVQELNLIPTGAVDVVNTSGTVRQSSYLINLYLPNNLYIPYLTVTKCNALSGGFDVLIGMDVINNGDFHISNFQGKTVFSFRIPSCNVIDYVQDYHRGLKKRVGRNAQCICGSGKKFKNCCLNKLPI